MRSNKHTISHSLKKPKFEAHGRSEHFVLEKGLNTKVKHNGTQELFYLEAEHWLGLNTHRVAVDERAEWTFPDSDTRSMTCGVKSWAQVTELWIWREETCGRPWPHWDLLILRLWRGREFKTDFCPQLGNVWPDDTKRTHSEQMKGKQIQEVEGKCYKAHGSHGELTQLKPPLTLFLPSAISPACLWDLFL